MKSPLSKQNWYIILFFTMILWGTLAPATRYLSNVPQSLLALIRTGFASIVLIFYLIITKKGFGIEKKDILKIMLVSLLAGYIPPLFYAIGIANTSSILGSLITNTNPLFIPILSIFLINQKFSIRNFFFTLVGFLGVILVVTGQKNLEISLNSIYFFGVLLLVLNALSIALNTILGQSLVKKYGGAKTTAYFMIIGTFALLIHNLMAHEILKISAISTKDLLLSIYIGIFPTAITWIIFLSSLKVLSPSESSMFKLLIPAFTAVFSIIFLNEALTLNLIIGGLIILASIYFMQKSSPNIGPDIE